jgi:hypothetical protein
VEIITKIKAFGFKVDEEMSGHHRFEPGRGPPGRHPFSFRLTWGPGNLGRWLDPGDPQFMTQEAEGSLTVGGLCQDTPCRGTLELRYRDEHLIRYTLDFGHEGAAYRFVGEKVNIRPWNLPVSHTTCHGRVTAVETGVLLSTSVTHFRLSTLPAFLGSFRLQ